MRKPCKAEILAPVGNRQMFDAALLAKADAVYLAAKDFGARAFAENFSQQDLEQLILDAHGAGMKVYVTMNTLMKEEELDQALDQAYRLAEVGVDALLVQDLGFFYLLQKLLPMLPLHASTQLSVTNLWGVREMEKLGFQRVVLGRETTVDELKEIAAHTDVELELFVHGSLCVSVSGQCLMSSFAGGRSGNRGRCAQPCRKTYRMLTEQGKVLSENAPLLSPRDLCTIDHMEELLQTGVRSLKIEGRMKKPEYVYQTVCCYRAVRDYYWENLYGEKEHPKEMPASSEIQAMKLMTNRPFTEGLLFHDFGADYHFGKEESTGQYLGRISRHGRQILLKTLHALQKGDSLRLPGKNKFLITLTASFPAGHSMDLSEYTDLAEGAAVYRVYTPGPRLALEEAEKTMSRGQEGLDMRVKLVPGHAAELSLRRASHPNVVRVQGGPVQEAQNTPLEESRVRRALGKLGNTPFYLKNFELEQEGQVFLPISELNRLRREGVRKVLSPPWTELLPNENEYQEEKERLLEQCLQEGRERPVLPGKPSLSVMIDDGEALPRETVDRLYLSQLDSFSKADVQEGFPQKYWKVPPLMEAGEGKIYQEKLQVLAREDHLPTGYYCHSFNEWGWIRTLPEELQRPVVFGIGFNLFNTFAFQLLWERRREFHLERMVLSPEVSRREMNPVCLARYPVEVFVYGRLDGMICRYCPVSPWKGCEDSRNCCDCPFRKGMVLEDAFGKRSFYREDGVTHILLPEVIDVRDKQEELQNMGVCSFLWVIHPGDWEHPRTQGHWKQGIE